MKEKYIINKILKNNWNIQMWDIIILIDIHNFNIIT